MGDRLSKIESIVGILIPPACREEVLGDLCERNHTAVGFVLDAFRTVPAVIVSQIRRTSDTRLLAVNIVVLYFAFFSAAWSSARPFLNEPWSFVRLAIPCAAALLALILDDAYTKPGSNSRAVLIRGLLIAAASVLISQAAIGGLALPVTVLIRGGGTAVFWILLIRSTQRRSKSRRGPA